MFTDRIFGALIALGFWEHLQDGVLESLGLGVSSSFPIRSHLSIWESGSGKAWTWPKSLEKKSHTESLTVFLISWRFFSKASTSSPYCRMSLEDDEPPRCMNRWFFS